MRRSSGFTLIEAVIVIAVMGIVLVPFTILVVNVMSQNAYSQAQSTAVALGEGELERVTGTRFSSVAAEAATAFAAPFNNFTHQVVVDYVNSGALNTAVVGPTDYKRVQIKINSPVSGTITLTTLVADDW
ncbi:MAG: type II secretion system protein [Candidatus Omnitrophica bacterium]|nr:type II secretion system protein [Candidatus Omnitrophota bacterium]